MHAGVCHVLCYRPHHVRIGYGDMMLINLGHVRVGLFHKALFAFASQPCLMFQRHALQCATHAS